MRTLRWCACLALLTMASQAEALDCKTATNQTDMNICADRTFKAADDQLNDLYRQVEARLAHPATPNAKALLTTAQRDWVAFRDAECDFRTSDSQGGSMHPMDVLGCRTELTTKRTADLKRYLTCKLEDSDCPTSASD